MKKLIIGVIVTIVTLAGLLTALSWQKTVKDVSIEEFAADYKAKYLTEESTMTQADALRVKKAFSLNTEDYEEVIYFYDEDMMSAEEFLFVKLNDASELSTVQSAAKERLASRKEAFDGYGSDQMAILNEAVLYGNDRYFCYFVSDHARDVLKLFKDYILE